MFVGIKMSLRTQWTNGFSTERHTLDRKTYLGQKDILLDRKT